MGKGMSVVVNVSNECYELCCSWLPFKPYSSLYGYFVSRKLSFRIESVVLLYNSVGVVE